MSFWQDLPRPFMVLAPMDDVTDTVFRQVVASCAAPDLYFTEFVNVDGLQSAGRPKLLHKLRFSDVEQPLIAQIWGKNPDNFYKTAQQIADGTLAKEFGPKKGINFAGVDLNMGCPQKNEVNSGTCSALMNDRPLAKQIIEATRKGLAGRMPLSIKTRTGYNEVDYSWLEFLLSQSIDMLTIHGRTKRQKSKVPANWQNIETIRQMRDKLAPETLIVGNGDVMNLAQAEHLAAQHNLDGIMIGRGVFRDPYVFAKTSPWSNMTPKQKSELYLKHVDLFAKTYKNQERPIQTLNKYCKIYISDFDGAKELREELMSQRSTDQLISVLSRV